jgi:S-adenosylmethionine hydrolase
VGPIVRELELLNIDRPKALQQGGIEGTVLYVDHFGNIVSNISADDLGMVKSSYERMVVHVGPIRVGPLRTTYSDVRPGEILAVLGSTGMLEIAVNQGNAAAQLRAGPGTVVAVR